MGTGSDSGKAVNQKPVPVIPLCYSYQFNFKDKCGAARNAWLRELAIAHLTFAQHFVAIVPWH